MPWRNLSQADIQAAMNECDQLGIVTFRTKHGKFQEARNTHMYSGNRGPYEARPLIAGAYAHANNGASLAPKNFLNDDAHVFLEKFGLRKVSI